MGEIPNYYFLNVFVFLLTTFQIMPILPPVFGRTPFPI